MSFCIFEPPSKKILYFLGYIIFAYIRELFEYKLDKIFLHKEVQFFEFAFFYTIGDLLCGLLVLIINKRTDSIKIDGNENSKNDLKYNSTMNNTLIFNDSQSNSKFLSLKRVLYLSIYDLLAQSCIVIYFFIYKDGKKIVFNNLNLTLIIDIVSRFILHKIRLGMKFYSHFYLSITLNILSFIILSISDIYFLKKGNDSKYWMYLGLTIISTILYSFENVEGKIGLNIEFLNVYSLIFYKGIIQSFFLVIIAIIALILKKFYLFTGFFDNSEHNVFFTIAIIFLYLMFNLFTNICIWKIIDIYSIQHLTIAKGGSSFLFYIMPLITNGKINYPDDNNLLYFTDIFGFILLFIGTLIHNEIIILNCCGFSTHTHKKLLEREKTDLKMAKDNESLDSSFETKDLNDSVKKIEESQTFKSELNSITELSADFLPEN